MRPGTRIGSYEILAPIGVGGMGEVYRALDTSLNRHVAIKVLSGGFAQNTDGVARLRREAQVLATLNHPHIASIYGLESAGGTLALALEFIEGDDLAHRLTLGPVPVAEALLYARQIVDALEAAHDKNIVHRDLKPANIKVTPDGVVKVLDFGLAKALAPAGALPQDAAHLATMTSPAMTELGIILGTAAYMSPEQARGRPVDTRADIWAFGVVLFEMLTGRRLFHRETATDTLAAVLTVTPDLTTLPASTPPGVRRLLARCLERDPRKRLRDIGDARPDLEDVPVVVDTGTPPPATSSWAWRVAPWMLATAAVVMAGWATWPRVDRAERPQSAAHLGLPFPADAEFLLAGSNAALTFSSDGRSVVMVGARNGVRRLFLRRIERPEAIEVPGSTGSTAVAFSPDGRSLTFSLGSGALIRMSLDDLVQKVVTTGVDLSGDLAWCPAGIVFGRGGALWIVPAEGGEPRAVTTLDAARKEVLHEHPTVLPGGRHLLFASMTESGGERIEAIPIEGGARVLVVEGATTPVWSPTGHLLFARDGAVLAAAFDPRSPGLIGTAVAVMPAAVVAGMSSGALAFMVSSTGDLLYVPTGFNANRVVSVGRDGAARPLDLPGGDYRDPRVSFDGRQVLLASGGSFIESLNLARGTRARLTAGAMYTNFPSWNSDATRVVFRRFNAPFWALADGSGTAAPIAALGVNDYPAGPGPDADSLLAVRVRPGTSGDLFLLSISGAFEAKPLISTPAYEGGPQLSPDGHWLLYQSDASGQAEIYVRRYPALDRQWQVSEGGGVQGRWSHTGREIYYRGDGHVVAVPLDPSGAEPVFGKPTALFVDEYEFGRGISIANYDVAHDGRFIMLRRDASRGDLRLVLNWTSELQKILAAGGVR